jgi:hypothetical protein
MKNIGLIVLLGLLLSAIVYCFILKTRLESNVMKELSQKDQINTEAEIIARKVDKEGIEHVTIEATKNLLPANEAKESAVSPGILDTTAMAIGILKKQVKDLTVINSTLLAENIQVKKIINSDNSISYNYSDKWVNLKFTPSIDTTSEGRFDFSYNADLNIVQYWKRNWFLGAKKSYIDIYSNDQRTKINNVKRLVVEQESPMFGLRLQASTSYNPVDGEISVGPAMRIDAGRFSFQGNYHWFPELNKWQPIIIGNYDIIRF